MQPAVCAKPSQLFLMLIFALSLGACGSDSTDNIPVASAEYEFGLAGSVGDGPVIGATVMVEDADGTVLYSDFSDASANYKVTGKVKRGDYPLVINVGDGTDLVTGARPDFKLAAIVNQRGGARTANLNPFGTFVKAIAGHMPGGLNGSNVQEAQAIVLQKLDFGLDKNAVPDPVATRIDAANVTTIVRASEALGEVVRRVRDRLISIGWNYSADEVVERIGADLVDGVLDGVGADGSDPRIAALTTLVSAQVMVETMSNRLHVGGADATQRMDNSILQISSKQIPEDLTADLLVTPGLLANASVALDALENLSREPSAAAIGAAVDGLVAGATAAQATAALPADSIDVIEGEISSLALASDAEIEIVNATARQGGGSVGGETEPVDPPSDTLPPEAPANHAPVITGTPAGQVMAGTWYDFQPQASDVDDDELLFSIINRPAWLSFDSVTGRLSGFPGTEDIRRWQDIRISVSDGAATVQLPAFDLVVLEVPNAAPTISGSPITALTVGQGYNFRPIASDADNDELIFSIDNMPAWANFNTANGRLYGVPTVADIGSSGSIRISVSDGIVTVSLPGFNINVNGPANTAPVISGNPATQIVEGQPYNFQPTTSDADGDTLSFSIDNQPAWASFNTATGRLYGAPGAGDVRSWTGIRIHVSDGAASASLSSFSIDVRAESSGGGEIELAWNAPTHNVDGSLLTDLAGYKLYFGRTGGTLTETREINDSSATSHVIEGLAAGDWRFTITAVNGTGQESQFSAETVVTVN